MSVPRHTGSGHNPATPDVGLPRIEHARRAAPAASAALAVAVLMAACASPGPERAASPLLDPAALGAGPTGVDTLPWPAADWWTAWGDPGLDELIATAIARQPTLQAAQARLQRAQASLAAASAADGPQLGLSADATDQRFSGHGLIPPPYAGTIRWTANAQVGAAWSPDFFGGQRAALDAAIGQARAAEADTQAAKVLLAGQVALGHFRLAQLLDTRAVVQAGLSQREQVLDLVRERQGAGLDTAVERHQAESQVAQARADLLALDDAVDLARRALAELSGQGPQALATWSPSLKAAHPAPGLAVLPADLLGRRADLTAARWRVEAASRGVDQAKAAFYPSVDLHAFVGLSSLGLDHFLSLGSRTYGAGPALHLPLFDGGLLRAQLDQRRSDVDGAVAAYNGTLLKALREVADALGSLRSLERQQQAQNAAADAALSAYELALQRYRAGLGNYLNVLTAQTQVLARQRAASELRGQRLAQEVTLSMALGGGFQDAAAAGRAAAEPDPAARQATARGPVPLPLVPAQPNTAPTPDSARTPT